MERVLTTAPHFLYSDNCFHLVFTLLLMDCAVACNNLVSNMPQIALFDERGKVLASIFLSSGAKPGAGAVWLQNSGAGSGAGAV